MSLYACGHKKRDPASAKQGLSYVGSAGLLALLRVLLLESLDSSFGINDLLRAGEKRMTTGANIDVDVPDGGSGFIAVAAGAMHCRLSIQRMNALFHVPTPGITAFAFAYSKARHFTLSRSADTRSAVHGLQELLIGLRAMHLVHQEFHGFHRA